MAETSRAKPPSGPKVSGTRTAVSLVFLVIVLVISVIELRAGLGQFLTLRSFNKVSENNLFKDISFAEAQGMVAAFPSTAEVQVGESEDVHHYYWYSLLRPLMGKPAMEIYVSADHSDPARAINFYTSTEGEFVASPIDPNAVPASSPMIPGGPMPPGMMGGGMMGGGMGGPPGGGPPGGGPPGGGPPGGGPPGGNSSRPPLEDEATEPDAADATKSEPAPTEPAPTEPAPTEPAPTEPAPTEPAPATETPTEPN